MRGAKLEVVNKILLFLKEKLSVMGLWVFGLQLEDN